MFKRTAFWAAANTQGIIKITTMPPETAVHHDNNIHSAFVHVRAEELPSILAIAVLLTGC